MFLERDIDGISDLDSHACLEEEFRAPAHALLYLVHEELDTFMKATKELHYVSWSSVIFLSYRARILRGN